MLNLSALEALPRTSDSENVANQLRQGKIKERISFLTTEFKNGQCPMKRCFCGDFMRVAAKQTRQHLLGGLNLSFYA